MATRCKSVDLRIVARSRFLLALGEWAVLGCLVSALLLAADPADSEWGLAEVSLVKYAPAVFATMGLFFWSIAVRGVPLKDGALICGALLGGWLTCAGLYTVNILGNSAADSFLGRGLCLSSLPVGFLLAFLRKQRARIANRVAPVFFVVCCAMFAGVVLWRAGYRFVSLPHIYHEQAVYFVPMAALGLQRRRFSRRVGHVIAWSLAAAFTVKITGFVFAAIALAGLFALEFMRAARRDVRLVARRRIALVVSLFSGLLLCVVAGLVYREFLPTGTPGVRLQTYSERLRMFASAPAFGASFVGSPITQVRWTELPSHSDLLDVFAFGGIAGGILFTFPLMAAICFGIGNFPRYVGRTDGTALAAVLYCAAFAFELCFNPVLHQPKLSVPFWMALGFLLGERRLIFEGERKGPRLRSRDAAVIHAGKSSGVRVLDRPCDRLVPK